MHNESNVKFIMALWRVLVLYKRAAAPRGQAPAPKIKELNKKQNDKPRERGVCAKPLANRPLLRAAA